MKRCTGFSLAAGVLLGFLWLPAGGLAVGLVLFLLCRFMRRSQSSYFGDTSSSTDNYSSYSSASDASFSGNGGAFGGGGASGSWDSDSSSGDSGGGGDGGGGD